MSEVVLSGFGVDGLALSPTAPARRRRLSPRTQLEGGGVSRFGVWDVELGDRCVRV